MHRILFLVTALFISITTVAQRQTLSYTFTYDTTAMELKVQVQLKGNSTGRSYLMLPDQFADQGELYKAIQQIEVTTPAARISSTEDSTVRLITHQPNENLQFTYILKQDWKGSFTSPLNNRAVLKRDYMQCTGYGLLVVPRMDSSQPVSVQLNWTGLPAGWQIGNSLHVQTRTYNGQVTLNELLNSIYVAGDFRIYQQQVRGQPVYVALRGRGWKFSDSAFANTITKILGMQRQFWNDYAEPYYFVSLIPYDGTGTSNGSALHQSFMMASTKDFGLELSLLRLLTHEYFHRWNGNKIAFTGDEFRNKWFSEGFTDYYAYKLLYKQGLISLPDYIKAINGNISDYYLSPVWSKDRATAAKNFWNTADYNNLPYRKGCVYALYLDQLIKQNSKNRHSLDNVMHDLLKRSNTNLPVTETYFLDLIKAYSGYSIHDQHRKFIDEGGLIPVHPQSLGVLAKLRFISIGAFDAGFDLGPSWKARKIEGVKENSAAWKAGIRNGLLLNGYSMNSADVQAPVQIQVEENGTKKTISYVAMSAEKIEVPQFQLKN